MIDTSYALFVLEVLAVLAMPGPTNSLLFVSGVTRGFRTSLPLVVAEVGAYIISISLLVFVLEPASRAHSTLNHLLRVLCSVYLAYIALWLWQSGKREVDDSHPITFLRVFLTTLVNPKNLIFAFGIFPIPTAASSAMLPYLVTFSVICTAVASGWIGAGTLLHSMGAHKSHSNWFYRGEALLLGGFAVAIFFAGLFADR